MDFAQAVRLAREGKEEGFHFLYEETYKSKYYLALKYMKNTEAAEDVLQDSYIKAFTKLDTLENPETFAGWLGIIVANTAKNALQKKNPLLFTDVAVNDENENFEYEIEDEDMQRQPEISYTRQETQELVHELLDMLPEEQRMCILMFHIEGQSIREIADTLGCSENTVKSRLNYGRKSIKAKAEELQKKGYTLYNIAPLSLLVYLLSLEREGLAAEEAFGAAGGRMAQAISRSVISAGADGAAKAGAAASSSAIKTGFLQTVAGKITVAVIGACAAAGVGAAVMNSSADTEQPTPAVEEIVEAPDMEEPVEYVEPEEEIDEGPVALTKEMYPELLRGNLTSDQFYPTLAFAPSTMSEEGLSAEEIQACTENWAGLRGVGLEYFGLVTEGTSDFHLLSLTDINRMLSVITDFQYTAENSPYEIDGDIIKIPAGRGCPWGVMIQSAEYTEEEMRIEYTRIDYGSDEGYEENRVAILRPQEDGLYMIEEIREN